MARDAVCPSCHRETYSAKWQTCFASDCKLNPQGRHDAPRKPVEARQPSVGVMLAPQWALDRIVFLEDEVRRLKAKIAEQAMALERHGNSVTETLGSVTIIQSSVTETGPTVTEIQTTGGAVTKKRGRPSAGGLSDAERARRYRERRKVAT